MQATNNAHERVNIGVTSNIILFVLMAFMSWLGIKKVKKEEL